MDIEITTAPGSNLTIPVKLYVGTEGGSFINYTKRDDPGKINAEEEISESKIELELYVNVTEEASVTIIMDEKTETISKATEMGSLEWL
ncbi:MAG: hypothetical protein IPH57_05790 [Saprospiraceae bacterium]|nr:hypothetical protein [Saprospiraceae bacterium]